MKLSVYNTLTNQREPFEPRETGKVSMYACGVTVYDVCHIGHAMQAIIYDVMRNYFKYLGMEVTYIRNYTDVDDKIIEKAHKLGIPPLVHSQRMIESCQRDLAALGVKPADLEPKVSEHIPEIIGLIEKLIEEGGAYESDGDVYFKVSAFPEYGKLSNRCTDELRAGARVEVNPKKQDPIDFALWKKAKEGEISWPSPWGEGRPGWHIECSALAMKYLGRGFDIHGGGKDLIFPHHENEIAQSEKAVGCCFAKFWVHNGLVTVEGRKMSKSSNNFLTISDALATFHPETIRYTILSHHYSSNIDFCEKSFYDAYHRLTYFYNTLERIEELRAAMPDYPQIVADGIEVPDVEQAFVKAMNDDFNTSAAIREIGLVFKFLNDLLAAKKPKLKRKMHVLVHVSEALKRCAAVLGLLDREPSVALAEIQKFLIREKKIDVASVEALVRERDQARAEKNWQRADEIRARLTEWSISVMDSSQGTTWQVQP